MSKRVKGIGASSAAKEGYFHGAKDYKTRAPKMKNPEDLLDLPGSSKNGL